MSQKKIIRVLIAKPGLDGHDKGAKIVAKGLKDAGIRQTADAILNTAIQESVDVIGLSILSGTHLSICEELIGKMKKENLHNVLVLVGGIIPKKDVSRLKEMGIAEVFRPSSTLSEISQFIQRSVSN
jgi:methylmalonyl-CoA mutase C-terminal domain/subunit